MAFLCVHPLLADTLELMNGAQVQGAILENNAADKTLTVEFTLGGNLAKRTVPYSTVHSITVNGVRTELTPKAGASTGLAANTRTPAEVRALIETVGGTEPDWLKGTKLNYPKTLDLSWPEKPEGKWDNQKNVGQFIWDVINPNSGRWQEGLKLMHHLLESNPDPQRRQRATMEIANMYFRFFQDHARAAWWWQQAGVTVGDGPGFHLAECYWRLGSKEMAVDFMKQTRLVYLDAIKLHGDMGETDRALELANYYNDHNAWLLAGDACRFAGRLQEARTFYEKVVGTSAPDAQGAQRLKRVLNRAQANLDALQLFELADVSKVRDGTYKDSSLGYEGQVEVSVKVGGKRIESVKITQHKEKQYYSSLVDVPAQIITKQGVKGVDATSRATITGEAIINATAKALAKGAQ